MFEKLGFLKYHKTCMMLINLNTINRDKNKFSKILKLNYHKCQYYIDNIHQLQVDIFQLNKLGMIMNPNMFCTNNDKLCIKMWLNLKNTHLSIYNHLNLI